jgi:hypothetical protein
LSSELVDRVGRARARRAAVTFVFGLEAGTAFSALDAVQWAVLALTVVAFLGAWIMAKRAGTPSHRLPIPGTFDSGIIDTDLLEPFGSAVREPRIVGVFETTFLVVLMAYAFFDRGFAWLHIPGTPLFVGEIVLLLGLAAMLSQPTPMLAAIRRSPPLKLLGLFMAWGFVLLLSLGLQYGIVAIRDSATWFYGIAALLTLFLILSNPQRLGRWLSGFARLLPWLVGWLFIAVTLDAMFGSGPLFTPDSQVSMFSHHAGNAGVVAVVCLAFVWLVDSDSKYFTPTQRLAITAACGALMLFVGLKNRGGLVSGVIGVIAILYFMNRNRAQLVAILVGVATLLASLALVSQASVALFGDREVSAEQFVNNLTSIVSPRSGGRSQTDTTEWRLQLWTRVLNDVNSEFPITGYGPGPDLGKIYNVTSESAVPLRNPHNSHVGVIARLGWVGFGLWFLMWGVWTLLLLDLHNRLARLARHSEAGLVGALVTGVGMILVNAFFDPTMEGPQVGMWVWFFFGLGASLQLVYHGFPALNVWSEARSGAKESFRAGERPG